MKNLDPRVIISKQIEEWFSSLSSKNQNKDSNVFKLIKININKCKSSLNKESIDKNLGQSVLKENSSEEAISSQKKY